MRRLLLLGLVLAGAGCGRIFSLVDPIPTDADTTGQFCYGKGMVHVCFSQLPTGTMIPGKFDTSNFGCNTNVVSGGDGLCVVAQTSFTIPASMTIFANGAMTDSVPLVLIATDAITIDGTLDAAEHHQGGNGSPAAGSNFTGCQAGTSPPSGAMYGGGGQGGSFIAAGGDGGAGTTAGGIAGATLAVPTTVHGGCPGRNGANSGGSGGNGGGAIYLIADKTISITGRLDASGAGGSSSNDFTLVGVAGGSGGGAGGMIGIDAPSVTIRGAVCAIGGSGGGGSTGVQSSSGGDASGNSTSCTPGNPGGSSGGGVGGAGATDGAGTAGSVGTTGGGGGGGGSSGFIRIYTAHTGSGAISPAPIQGM